MNKVKSFPPIANPSASILILGSIPGQASLDANQYYAHPRNVFWPIMGKLFNFDDSLSYQARIESLKAANIAVWDVLQACIRVGSLDSAIKPNSRIPNDFEQFFKQHHHIRLIAFNGAEAEKSFKKIVVTSQKFAKIHSLRLPSTSPAHTISLQSKLSAWQAITPYCSLPQAQ